MRKFTPRTYGIAGAIVAVIVATAITFAVSTTTPREAQALTVGIGDNGYGMFDDPNFQRLDTKISRKILPWDFYKFKEGRDDLTLWLAGAKREGIQPLIAFNHSLRSPQQLPSVNQFKYALRYLLKEHPEVRTFSPWNEANHHTQPTAKYPKRAAQYYNASRQICRDCTIVAADVVDIKNMIPWLNQFRLHATRPSLWGLHSYGDANRNVSWSQSSLKLLLDNVNGKVWLTEVGGLVAFGMKYSYSESRAKNGTRRTLSLARKSHRVKRVYFYSWFGTHHQPMRRPYRWDSGIVSWKGKPRPAFYVLRDWFGK